MTTEEFIRESDRETINALCNAVFDAIVEFAHVNRRAEPQVCQEDVFLALTTLAAVGQMRNTPSWQRDDMIDTLSAVFLTTLYGAAAEENRTDAKSN